MAKTQCKELDLVTELNDDSKIDIDPKDGSFYYPASFYLVSSLFL